MCSSDLGRRVSLCYGSGLACGESIFEQKKQCRISFGWPGLRRYGPGVVWGGGPDKRGKAWRLEYLIRGWAG